MPNSDWHCQFSRRRIPAAQDGCKRTEQVARRMAPEETVSATYPVAEPIALAHRRSAGLFAG